MEGERPTEQVAAQFEKRHAHSVPKNTGPSGLYKIGRITCRGRPFLRAGSVRSQQDYAKTLPLRMPTIILFLQQAHARPRKSWWNGIRIGEQRKKFFGRALKLRGRF